MRALIVHAHHEPQSFCSALFRRAVQTLTQSGHEVITSDLYAQRFDPVSDRRNFTSVHDAGYLKQQREERHASEVGGFAPELETEIRKLESCDLLVFSFPIWWFGLPAILKGWVDRAMPMRRIYGDGKLYENGLGQGRKRAMVLMTVGGGPEAYSGRGVNPAMETVLAPIHHGIFWFNGFLPLEPFIAWRPARITPEARAAYLGRLCQRLQGIEREQPYRLPPLADFPGFGSDVKKRFMVTLAPRGGPDAPYESLAAAQAQHVEDLKRRGVVLARYAGSGAEGPREFLLFREASPEQVREHLASLPRAAYSTFEITELE